ncbi:flagellin assembly protein [Kozakia baliensis NRIC 0488]|nr:flagellin assembly protein [Kozakia baliensis NRIC 0488]
MLEENLNYAALQYQKRSGASLPSRDIEIMALKHANTLLSDKATVHLEPRRLALSSNIKLWSLLMQAVHRTDCPLPAILKKDLTTIGNWAMSYSNMAMNSEKPLRPLIDINQDMIDGLSAQEERTSANTLGTMASMLGANVPTAKKQASANLVG